MSLYDQPTEPPPHYCNDCCGKCQSCPCECCGSCGAAPDVACESLCPEQLERTNTRLMFQLDGQREQIAALTEENARLKSERDILSNGLTKETEEIERLNESLRAATDLLRRGILAMTGRARNGWAGDVRKWIAELEKKA